MKIFFVVAAATLVAGCGLTSAQRDALERYGKATSGFGSTTAASIPAMREGIRELNAARFVIGPIPNDLQPGEASPSSLAGSVPSASVVIRVRAAAALAEYGAALSALATSADPSKAVEQVKTIGNSLADVPFFSRSADDLKLAGAALGSFTGLFLEEYRLRAIRDVVNRSDDFVQTASMVFATDFRTRSCSASASVQAEAAISANNVSDVAAAVASMLAADLPTGSAREACGLALSYLNTARTVRGAATAQEALLRSRPMASVERNSIMGAAVLGQRHTESATAMSEAGLKVALAIGTKHAELRQMLNETSHSTVDTSQLVAVANAFAATALAFRRN